MKKKLTAREAARRLIRAPKSEPRDVAIRKAIRQIPRGKVATYGQVAAAAGYPRRLDRFQRDRGTRENRGESAC